MRQRGIIRVKIWRGADISELLKAGVHAFVKQWLVNPSVIAMHPTRAPGYNTFNGVEIVKSTDILEDEIRFY